jgi:hypothetical protein
VSRMVLKLAITAALGGVLFSKPIVAQMPAPQAQIPPPAPKAAHVKITQGPVLELARDDFAIIRWTTNNPGGADDHFAIVHYGTDPKDLNQTGKNHVRLNPSHPDTMFRAFLYNLKPKTTYYYIATSMGADGKSDGVQSPVNKFTTPAAGERIVNYPQPK